MKGDRRTRLRKEPGVWRFLQRLLRAGDIFFDIGANQGFYSILGSKCVGDQGLVVAFEPAPRERIRLQRNRWLNSCRNVVVEDLAVGSHSGVTELFECLGHQGSLSSLRPPGNDATARRQVIQVPITTLDDYVKDRKFDSLTAIKLDVEGAELAALQGGMEALNAFRPVVCQGIRQFPTPFSIALMIWDVTVSYTSRFSVAVFSFVDIEAPIQLLVFRDRARRQPVAIPFLSGV